MSDQSEHCHTNSLWLIDTARHTNSNSRIENHSESYGHVTNDIICPKW